MRQVNGADGIVRCRLPLAAQVDDVLLGVDVELPVHALRIRLHGVLRDVESARDGGHRFPEGQQLERLTLAVGQAVLEG